MVRAYGVGATCCRGGRGVSEPFVPTIAEKARTAVRSPPLPARPSRGRSTVGDHRAHTNDETDNTHQQRNRGRYAMMRHRQKSQREIDIPLSRQPSLLRPAWTLIHCDKACQRDGAHSRRQCLFEPHNFDGSPCPCRCRNVLECDVVVHLLEHHPGLLAVEHDLLASSKNFRFAALDHTVMCAEARGAVARLFGQPSHHNGVVVRCQILSLSARTG